VAQTEHQKENESYFSPLQIYESEIPTVSLPYNTHEFYENFKYQTAPLKCYCSLIFRPCIKWWNFKLFQMRYGFMIVNDESGKIYDVI
jgi:hypothetical protein